MVTLLVSSNDLAGGIISIIVVRLDYWHKINNEKRLAHMLSSNGIYSYCVELFFIKHIFDLSLFLEKE